MAKNQIKVELVGLDDLIDLLVEINKGANKVVTPAAKAGANIALASARARAPEDSGDLKKGIIITGEKKRGAKKVYQVGMDPSMRDVFSRITTTGTRRVKSKKGKVFYKKGDYYYPASIEFGFINRDGTKTKGVHFLRDSLTSNVFQIEKAMLEKLSKIIDKEMKKQGKR